LEGVRAILTKTSKERTANRPNTGLFRLNGLMLSMKGGSLKAKPETEEPVAPVNTDLTYLNAKPETEEPVALITTDLTDMKAKPETEETVAPEITDLTDL